MRKILNKFYPEIFILIFAAFTRFFHLDYPKSYIFDEVYHAFTAEQMVKGNPAAWEWWNPNPTGFAYEWTHPPLAKEFMALSIFIFGDTSFAWRFFSALFGFGSIILIYLIARHLFNRKIAIISALIASLDGLLFVMSRIAMNDSYFLFFSLFAIFLFLKNKNLLMGLTLGLAVASKWTGVFAAGIIGILFLFQNSEKLNWLKILGIIFFPFPFFFQNFKTFKFLLFLIIIPTAIYLVSYTPFFLQHHSPPGQNFNNFQTFIELQQQMWWYHTNLKATHPYQSTPYDWIFDLRPVWLFVDYQKNSIANIYTLDNPIIVWSGLLSIFYLISDFVKKRGMDTGLVLLSYFGFFIFWFRAPRIMFNYHYLASTAFLAIAIAFTLDKLLKIKNGKIIFVAYLLLLIILFIYFYPLWTGVHVPRSFNDHYYWLKTWK